MELDKPNQAVYRYKDTNYSLEVCMHADSGSIHELDSLSLSLFITIS